MTIATWNVKDVREAGLRNDISSESRRFHFTSHNLLLLDISALFNYLARNPGADSAVVVEVCTSIRNLTRNSEENRESFGSAGVCEGKRS